MLRLKQANFADAAQEYAFVQTIPRCENGFTNDWLGWSYAEFVEKALPQMQRWARGEDLPAGFVPESFYFLWDGEQIVGHCRIRHRLTPALAEGRRPLRLLHRPHLSRPGLRHGGPAPAAGHRPGPRAGGGVLPPRQQGQPGLPARHAPQRGLHPPRGRRALLRANPQEQVKKTECGPHRGPHSPSAEKPSRRLRGGPFL